MAPSMARRTGFEQRSVLPSNTANRCGHCCDLRTTLIAPAAEPRDDHTGLVIGELHAALTAHSELLLSTLELNPACLNDESHVAFRNGQEFPFVFTTGGARSTVLLLTMHCSYDCE